VSTTCVHVYVYVCVCGGGEQGGRQVCDRSVQLLLLLLGSCARVEVKSKLLFWGECLLHVSTFATTRVALPTGVEPG
jgi:hypothetical protein